MPEMEEKLGFPRFPFLDLPCLQGIPRTIFVKPGGHSPVGVGKVQGAGAGWTGGKVRSPECRVRRAARQLTTSLVS